MDEGFGGLQVAFLVSVWFEAGEVEEEDGVGTRVIVVKTRNEHEPNAGQIRKGGHGIGEGQVEES